MLYINAHEPGPQDPRTRVFSLFTSADGSTFGSTVTPQGKPAFGVTPGNGVLLSDGTFVAVFENFTNTALLGASPTGINPRLGWLGVVTSHDGGKHLDEPVRVADSTNAM